MLLYQWLQTAGREVLQICRYASNRRVTTKNLQIEYKKDKGVSYTHAQS